MTLTNRYKATEQVQLAILLPPVQVRCYVLSTVQKMCYNQLGLDQGPAAYS
jgi:hypothetical protein